MGGYAALRSQQPRLWFNQCFEISRKVESWVPSRHLCWAEHLVREAVLLG